MTTARVRDGNGGQRPPDTGVVVTILCLITLLMTFSVVAWVVGNPTLAAVSGTGACTLAGEIIRRFLAFGGPFRRDQRRRIRRRPPRS